jgi:hypothetical protein
MTNKMFALTLALLSFLTAAAQQPLPESGIAVRLLDSRSGKADVRQRRDLG